MTAVGIDQIGVYTPAQYIETTELAKRRQVDPNKFTIGIGQDQMAVPNPTTDIVSMGANAARVFLSKVDTSKIGLLIVGTESGIDQSKASALFIKSILNLPNEMRAFEIKEACFGATAGIMTAQDYVKSHPGKTALVIASDISRYGLNSGGEVTQGAGAVAMLISEHPRILEFLPQSASYSDDVNDFWRPNYSATAFVDGKYSTEKYLEFFTHTFNDYLKQTNLKVADFEALTYHLPFTKMGIKAQRLAVEGQSDKTQTRLSRHFEESAKYCRQIGNLYTGSLYLSLVSLLHHKNLKSGDLIGLYSYGSGSVAEFFAGHLVNGYQNQLSANQMADFITSRQLLSIDEYEAIYTECGKIRTDDYELMPEAVVSDGEVYFAGVKDHLRQYKVKGA
ncbi:hydroxymethylglutaryl-CoA synthase [Holzapfeliella floricola]|uniref:Hydroxymethylglutaryl-CoA synthase n=1 Tax=Holzapfeliella floricola DSM 23037 = JCM 16512 TaxID=1423744 RepID=A0A0R2DK68_9LACO|nr:hydroxymethylglutaryl-CoA synthase [Holzapfeliella floricola]KRN04488.1 hydroxymethylglutaryl-CoA synthase [Holzapfeliella floricola DSM 23037 = JCM 16512]